MQANVDGAGVDDEGLVPGIALAHDDLSGLELPPLDVAEREVLVDLEPDGGQVKLRLDGQPRVGPAAQTALEDAHVAEPPLAQDHRDA